MSSDALLPGPRKLSKSGGARNDEELHSVSHQTVQDDEDRSNIRRCSLKSLSWSTLESSNSPELSFEELTSEGSEAKNHSTATKLVKQEQSQSKAAISEIIDGVASNLFAPYPERNTSLQELLSPHVAHEGRLRPPNVLELEDVFAAISALGGLGSVQGGSHYIVAIQTLAKHGFRRSSLVLDKLGLSIHCEAQEHLDWPGQQVDFPWATISDIHEPRSNLSFQGCAVTFGIREPTGLGDGPNGGLALVLRLQDRDSAQALVVAARAFKAYETQMLLMKACSSSNFSEPSLVVGLSSLLLDDQGYPFWSEVRDDGSSGPHYMNAFQDSSVYVDQADETPCCNLCWC